ncbi:MAG: DUF1847 domain-containing protein [Oscillospiraceae bacterium]
MYQCADCTRHGCADCDMEKTMDDCPSKETAVQETAKKHYGEAENYNLAHSAALVEAEGYGKLCRMEEIMRFARRAGYQKLGLVFCIGLKNEAKTVNRILTANGFEVVSVVCKNGGLPKSSIGIKDEETLSGCGAEVMCNPIGQALLMNASQTQLNILLGLCVGHDTLAMKYLEAPTTVLAVKDRVTGHNPLAAIYLADGYYKKRFFQK